MIDRPCRAAARCAGRGRGLAEGPAGQRAPGTSAGAGRAGALWGAGAGHEAADRVSSGMRLYLVHRLAAMLATLLGVSLIVFLMMRLIPGTVVEQLLGQSALVSEETLRSLRAFFGLGRPWHVQYLDWLAGVVRGDLGTS